MNWKNHLANTNSRRTGPSWLSQRPLGLLLVSGKRIGHWLTGASQVTIPETIAGHISVPVLLSFINCRMSTVSLFLSPFQYVRDRSPGNKDVYLHFLFHLHSQQAKRREWQLFQQTFQVPSAWGSAVYKLGKTGLTALEPWGGKKKAWIINSTFEIESSQPKKLKIYHLAATSWIFKIFKRYLWQLTDVTHKG